MEINGDEHDNFKGSVFRGDSRSMFKGIVIPVVVSVLSAVLVGLPASYLGVQLAINTIDIKVNYIETDLIDIKLLLSKVNTNQIELARIGERMTHIDQRMKSHRVTLGVLSEAVKDRYSRTEARKDNDRLEALIKKNQ